MANEKTFVMIKPDGVQRNLVGKIVARFEEAGLKVKEMKLLSVDDEFAKKHYPLDEEWAKAAFEKTKTVYDKAGKELVFKDHIEMGTALQQYLVTFVTEGPVMAMVLEGNHAIELVRKMVGATEPRQAAPGTIRGDFASTESYALADEEKRAVRNLIHASDSTETATKEIKLWFNQ